MCMLVCGWRISSLRDTNFPVSIICIDCRKLHAATSCPLNDVALWNDWLQLELAGAQKMAGITSRSMCTVAWRPSVHPPVHFMIQQTVAVRGAVFMLAIRNAILNLILLRHHMLHRRTNMRQKLQKALSLSLAAESGQRAAVFKSYLYKCSAYTGALFWYHRAPLFMCAWRK